MKKLLFILTALVLFANCTKEEETPAISRQQEVQNRLIGNWIGYAYYEGKTTKEFPYGYVFTKDSVSLYRGRFGLDKKPYEITNYFMVGDTIVRKLTIQEACSTSNKYYYYGIMSANYDTIIKGAVIYTKTN